jgi:DNA-binding MarR family transcriptional regulator
MGDDGARTRGGEAATRLVLAAFRANGAFLAAGDRLVARHGLTAARWQVLGALALADRPLTVAQAARRMGLARQSVHASVRRLVADGLLAFLPNEDHRRSPLVALTDAGERAYAAADLERVAWANRLADGVADAELEIAERVLGELCSRLEREAAPEPADPNEEAIA